MKKETFKQVPKDSPARGGKFIKPGEDKEKKIIDNKGFIDVKKESGSKKVPGSKTTETIKGKTEGPIKKNEMVKAGSKGKFKKY